MTCDIHDCRAVICSSCRHRAYIYERKNQGVSPEQFMGAHDLMVSCDECGRQCVSIDKVDPWCFCHKCKNFRMAAQDTPVRINAALECRCR